MASDETNFQEISCSQIDYQDYLQYMNLQELENEHSRFLAEKEITEQRIKSILETHHDRIVNEIEQFLSINIVIPEISVMKSDIGSNTSICLSHLEDPSLLTTKFMEEIKNSQNLMKSRHQIHNIICLPELVNQQIEAKNYRQAIALIESFREFQNKALSSPSLQKLSQKIEDITNHVLKALLIQMQNSPNLTELMLTLGYIRSLKKIPDDKVQTAYLSHKTKKIQKELFAISEDSKFNQIYKLLETIRNSVVAVAAEYEAAFIQFPSNISDSDDEDSNSSQRTAKRHLILWVSEWIQFIEFTLDESSEKVIADETILQQPFASVSRQISSDDFSRKPYKHSFIEIEHLPTIISQLQFLSLSWNRFCLDFEIVLTNISISLIVDTLCSTIYKATKLVLEEIIQNREIKMNQKKMEDSKIDSLESANIFKNISTFDCVDQWITYGSKQLETTIYHQYISSFNCVIKFFLTCLWMELVWPVRDAIQSSLELIMKTLFIKSHFPWEIVKNDFNALPYSERHQVDTFFSLVLPYVSTVIDVASRSTCSMTFNRIQLKISDEWHDNSKLLLDHSYFLNHSREFIPSNIVSSYEAICLNSKHLADS